MILSIITVNRNNASGLKKTIESVISQNRYLYEFIIIDGASVDESLEIINQYKQYIDFYISEPDDGIYNAMNKGIDHARGEYIIFMNSGDEFVAHDTLSKIKEYEMDTDFIFGGILRTNQGKQISAEMPDKNVTLYTLLYRTICHQSTLIRTSTIKELGGYDEALKITADVCFLIKATIKYGKTNKTIPLYISKYDVTGISAGKNSLKIIKQEKFNYFRHCFPHLYSDYIKMHNIVRLSPTNILRYIRLKVRALFRALS
ncbi:glycosyltransferase family 2 protein [Bacteroides sp.]|uniref:glycosyltransferase family 2 protein n=1 Tax=Bacteroides sp. TaxID=29523 RepID=UPI0025BAB66A|nr:glycosyltransferase family 2 protein [Bacteroides sp.]